MQCRYAPTCQGAQQSTLLKLYLAKSEITRKKKNEAKNNRQAERQADRQWGYAAR